MFYGFSNLKVSAIQTDEYNRTYRIPFAQAASYIGDDPTQEMFGGTGGTFTGTPEVNTTYYLHQDNYIVW